MSKYKIEYVKDDIYSALIVVLTYENIFKELDKIEKELIGSAEVGMIIFDNLLKSGSNEERFIEAFFDGKKIDRQSFKFSKIDRNNSVRQKSCSILREHETYLKMFIADKPLRDLLISGVYV